LRSGTVSVDRKVEKIPEEIAIWKKKNFENFVFLREGEGFELAWFFFSF
jgi:fumarate reductase subunit C